MRDTSAMFEPVVEVRDVLESFLADGVLIDGWRQALTDASDRFGRLATLWSDDEMLGLGRRVETLAAHGLPAQDVLTRSVASDMARLLSQVRAPGIPRPDDEDWGF